MKMLLLAIACLSALVSCASSPPITRELERKDAMEYVFKVSKKLKKGDKIFGAYSELSENDVFILSKTVLNRPIPAGHYSFYLTRNHTDGYVLIDVDLKNTKIRDLNTPYLFPEEILIGSTRSGVKVDAVVTKVKVWEESTDHIIKE